PPVDAGQTLTINNIKFVTACGGSELDLVSNSPNDPCGYITVVANHVENGVATIVPSDFTWTVKDQTVAKLDFVVGHEHDATQHLSTDVDTFSSPSGIEPETEVVACTIPQLQVDPVCGTLPVKAVVNLAGQWIFQGWPFGDMGNFAVEQDNRQLTIDISGQGAVNGRQVTFNWGGFDFVGKLMTHDDMEGDFSLAGSTEVISHWSAKRQ
ncbi:MAG: hypothetical protein PHH26_02495, partial [Candidatus Thermoplasmatota archaeon]|nr:hypothetical protein [Candidatus Thermoplasmatota archaeon]